jgi:hypothetical protein
MHKVWDPVPWVVDVYNDSEEARMEMHHLLTVNFGRERWWPSDRDGNWQFGGATVDGWTYVGFKGEEMLRRFVELVGEERVRGL